MLSITEKQYIEIRNKYPDALDGESAFDFVNEVLTAEAEAIEAECPWATRSVDRMHSAAYQVFEIGSEISGDNFKVV